MSTIKTQVVDSTAPAGDACCPPHLWVLANGWRRLSDVRYVCRHCGAPMTRATASAQDDEGPIRWPTWAELVDQP